MFAHLSEHCYYRFRQRSLIRPSYFFISFFCRYFRFFRRSATICRSPRREWKSFLCLRKCVARSSIWRVNRETCASGEPVSESWRWVFLIVFSLIRFDSMLNLVTTVAVFCPHIYFRIDGTANDGIIKPAYPYRWVKVPRTIAWFKPESKAFDTFHR